MTTPTKEELLQTLTTFVRQRPGFDPANYGDMASYTKDLHAFNELALFCALHDVLITPSMAGACGNRLTYDSESKKWNYCADRYWDTEYRAIACRTLAHVILEHFARNGANNYAEMLKNARRNFSARTVKHFF